MKIDQQDTTIPILGVVGGISEGPEEKKLREAVRDMQQKRIILFYPLMPAEIL